MQYCTIGNPLQRPISEPRTGCPKLNLFVLGRQLELIGPPQHRTIVDIMSDDSGNHWGVVGELKTTLILSEPPEIELGSVL